MKRMIACLTLSLVGCPSPDAGHDHSDFRSSTPAPDEGDQEPGEAGHDDEAAHDEENTVELSAKALRRIRIRTGKVEEREMSRVLSTTGRVDFDQDHVAHVAPRVRGRVHRVDVTLGSKVKRGQLLGLVDSIELGRSKSTMLRAKAELSLAAKTLAREKALLVDRVTSEQSVLEATATHERALADVQAARQNLKLLGLSNRQIDALDYRDPTAALFPIRAPMNGTVVEKHVSIGEVVSPETNLFSVADLSRVWIWIDVYERDLGRVHLEDDVVVRVDAFPERTFEGKLAYIRSLVDSDTRTARARIDVRNLDGALRPGMFADVTIVDPHTADGTAPEHSLVVPASAVQRDGERHVVFVPTKERHFERRQVTIGTRTETSVEILSGVEAGETVVTRGTFYLESEAAKSSMGGGHSH